MTPEMIGFISFLSLFAIAVVWGFFTERHPAGWFFLAAFVFFVIAMIFAGIHDHKYYVDDHEKCRQVNGQWVEGSGVRSYCIYPKGL